MTADASRDQAGTSVACPSPPPQRPTPQCRRIFNRARAAAQLPNVDARSHPETAGASSLNNYVLDIGIIYLKIRAGTLRRARRKVLLRHIPLPSPPLPSPKHEVLSAGIITIVRTCTAFKSALYESQPPPIALLGNRSPPLSCINLCRCCAPSGFCFSSSARARSALNKPPSTARPLHPPFLLG